MNAHFDKVFIITIPKREQYVRQCLQDYEIGATIIEGVNKYSPTLVEDAVENGIIVESPTYEYKDSKIAVHWAHINALKAFLQDPYAQTAVICEDDLLQINSNEKTSEILEQCMVELSNEHWDLLFLGRCNDHKETIIPISDNIIRTFESVCRGSYAVTRKCAELLIQVKLTPRLSVENNPSAGDVANKNLIKSGLITALAIEPPLYSQNRSKIKSENGHLGATSTYAPAIYLYMYHPYTSYILMLLVIMLGCYIIFVKRKKMIK